MNFTLRHAVAAILVLLSIATPVNAAADAETWSCEIKMNEKPYTQKWTISDGRMTAPQGKGYYRVSRNDVHVLMAFLNIRNPSNDPVLNLIIIDKNTGSYFDIDTIAMSNLGKAYDETSEPTVETGHCTPLRR